MHIFNDSLFSISFQVNNYNERNYKRSTLIEYTNQAPNIISLHSAAMVTPLSLSHKKNGTTLTRRDEIVKDPSSVVANEAREAKRIGYAVDDLAAKFMAIIAEERLAGLQRGCHVNNKKFGLDIEAIFRLHPRKRPRFYFSDKYRVNILTMSLQLYFFCSNFRITLYFTLYLPIYARLTVTIQRSLTPQE